jgi:hypothetical protein
LGNVFVGLGLVRGGPGVGGGLFEGGGSSVVLVGVAGLGMRSGGVHFFLDPFWVLDLSWFLVMVDILRASGR